MAFVRISWVFCFFSLFCVQVGSAQSVQIPSGTNFIQSHFIDERITTQKRIFDRISYLASPELEGRRTGTIGNVKASNYIRSQVSALGLTSPSELNNFENKFSFLEDDWILQQCWLFGNKLQFGTDYIIVPNQSVCSDELIVKDILFWDFKSKKKFPATKKNSLIIVSNVSFYLYDSLVNKHKSEHVILFEEKDLSKYEKLLVGDCYYTGEDQPFYHYGVISSQVVEKWLNGGRYQKKQKICINKNKSDLLYSGFHWKVKNAKPAIQSGNMVAVVNPIGKITDSSYVVVSAHFDHLGKVGSEYYPGADDNGTGTAALLEMAQVLQDSLIRKSLKRRVLFLFFTGEELGLFGSKYFTNTSFFVNNKFDCVFNIDMIGRADAIHNTKEPYTYIIGADRINPNLDSLIVRSRADQTNLILDRKYNDPSDPEKLYERSDHYNFASKGIPSVFFFGGLHSDYHKTTDTPEKINYQLLMERTMLITKSVVNAASKDWKELTN